MVGNEGGREGGVGMWMALKVKVLVSLAKQYT